MSLRCVYIDLDGTLLGRGASLLHDGEGGVSLEGVRAVQACLRAGVEVVLMSGRRRAQVHEDARLLGQDSFIYEAGACLVLDGGPQFGGEERWLTGELAPGNLASGGLASGGLASGESAPGNLAPDELTSGELVSGGLVSGESVSGNLAPGELTSGGLVSGELAPDELTIAEQIERSGAPALLLERYEGRLEYHEPWHVAREVSHLFRGLVDAGEVDRLLAEHGFGHLRLVDNGVVTRRSPALAGLEHVRGYHLVPAGASKAGAVALHMRVRGYAREETLAVGDSREDLACAEHVGAFWLVANAVARDPSIRAAVGAWENVRVARAGHGAGVYEAVVSTLME